MIDTGGRTQEADERFVRNRGRSSGNGGGKLDGRWKGEYTSGPTDATDHDRLFKTVIRDFFPDFLGLFFPDPYAHPVTLSPRLETTA